MRGRRSEPLRSDAEAWSLSMQHYGIRTSAVGKWRGVHDPEDIAQESLLAMHKAGLTWDPSKGPYKTWAKYYIKTQIGHMPNAAGHSRDQVKRRTDNGEALPRLLSTEDRMHDDGSTRGERLPDTENTVEQTDTDRDCAVIVRDLKAIAARFAQYPAAHAALEHLLTGASCRECAERYDTSREYVEKWSIRLLDEYNKDRARRLAAARRNHRRAA